jgi:hypothetical protein
MLASIAVRARCGGSLSSWGAEPTLLMNRVAEASHGVPATNDELKALLVPFKDEALTMWPVNRQKIGNVRKGSRGAEPEALEVLSGS